MSKFKIDGDLIRELAALLDETGLTEIEITENGRGVRVARGVGGTVVSAPLPVNAAVAPTEAAEAADPPMDGEAVPSPMVGTAYLSPQPGDPPFVKVGDTVLEGQTLMIVEAMKVMNPITAPRAGTVKAVLVEDSQPVEYGDTLVVLM
jgi:acetyl-CoA carboxylase biotin carboxyl carrier protein